MKKAVFFALVFLPAIVLAQASAPVVEGGIFTWISTNATLVFGVLWGIAETLALIPSVKSSSVFTLILNTLQSVKNTFFPTLPK